MPTCLSSIGSPWGSPDRGVPSSPPREGLSTRFRRGRFTPRLRAITAASALPPAPADAPRMPPRLRRAAWAVVLLAAGGADAFYIPGVHPQNFDVGEEVPLKVGRVISTLSSLPFEYYRMPMCRPDEITSSMANLGEVLTGDVLYSSPYTLRMQINDSCAELCNVPHFGVTGRPSNLWKSLVEMGYRVTMRMDNMPAVELVAVDGQDGNMNPEQRQQLSQSTGEDPVLAFVGQVGLPLGAVKPMGDADIRLVPREHRDYFVNKCVSSSVATVPAMPFAREQVVVHAPIIINA